MLSCADMLITLSNMFIKQNPMLILFLHVDWGFHIVAFFQITHRLDPLIMEPKPRITVAFVSSRRLDLDEMEEDEDEEDDDDDDFDFSTAGIKSKLPGKRIVEMKVISGRKLFHQTP